MMLPTYTISILC